MSDLNAQLAGLRQQAIDNYLSDQALQQNRINTVASLGQQAENSYYNRINDAMNLWATLGYADDTVAGILGVARWNAHHGPELPDLAAELPAGPAGSGVADANRAYANDLAGQMLQLGLTPEAATLQTAGISAADAGGAARFLPPAAGIGADRRKRRGRFLRKWIRRGQSRDRFRPSGAGTVGCQ